MGTWRAAAILNVSSITSGILPAASDMAVRWKSSIISGTCRRRRLKFAAQKVGRGMIWSSSLPHFLVIMSVSSCLNFRHGIVNSGPLPPRYIHWTRRWI